MDLLFLIGKILFGGFFVWNGIEHFTNVKKLTAYAKHVKVPMPKESVYVSGILLLVGGFSIILEAWVGIGIICLLVFLLTVTFMAHRFWEVEDEGAKMSERIAFMKNMALVGALIMLLVIGVA